MKIRLLGCRDMEVFLDLITMTWACWFLFLGQYSGLAIHFKYLEIAPVYAWTGVAFLAALLNIVFLVCKSKLTLWTRSTLIFFWLFSSIAFILGDPTKASSFIYPYIALGYIYTLFGE